MIRVVVHAPDHDVFLVHMSTAPRAGDLLCVNFTDGSKVNGTVRYVKWFVHETRTEYEECNVYLDDPHSQAIKD